jgi:hypothetical protein
MRVLAALALAMGVNAASVKDGNAPLRSGCYEDSTRLATLSKGTPVTLRYALSGESIPCYKVAVEVDGKKVEGYLPGSMIDGLDTFDKARRDAAWLDMSQIMGAIKNTAERSASSSLSAGATGPVAYQASLLLEASQPGKALELLEAELKKRRDPGLLTLAGVAAWRSDAVPKALEYWRASLDLQPNAELEAMYKRVEREKNGDKSGDRLMGMRVQLRYEGVSISADAARQMLSALDEEFGRIANELGCVSTERVPAIAQSPEAYRQTTGAAEWSGGQFDGKIRVPVFDRRGIDANLRRTLAHELAHACMYMLGRWPMWIQEGIAQKVSGEAMDPAVRARLKELAAQGKLPGLSQLEQDWGRMNTDQAALAYGLSLLAVEVFVRDYSAMGLRNLFQNGERLASITADLDRRLSQ